MDDSVSDPSSDFEKKMRNDKKVEEEYSKISVTRLSIVLFMMLFIDLLGFTVILPLMPKLLEYYGKDGSDGLYMSMQQSVSSYREFVGAPDTPKWNSVLFGGFIGSLFSMLQFIASPFIGAASDVYGRRPLLLLTMVGIALSYVLWALANNFTLFVIARIIGGLCKGNVSLSTAVVADAFKPSERGRGMALVGIAFSMGFLLGPMIGAGFAGGAVKFIGSGEFFVGPAVFALTMAVLDIFYIYCSFEETLPKRKRMPSLLSAQNKVMDLINPISLFLFKPVPGVSPQEKKSMRRIGGIYFVYMFLYSGLEFTLTFLTYLRFNFTSMQQGKMFFILGLVMIVIQAGYTRRRPSGSEKSTAVSGILMLIPAFLSIGFANGTVLFYIGVVQFAYASATVVPSMTTMISGYGTDSQKGAVMGVFRALGALARAFGPMVASAGYWSFGAEMCYLSGAVLMVIPLVALLATQVTYAEKKS